jgi:hypothetical protein
MEKPDGAIFFGQSYSVPCIRMPDSIKMTALSSGLEYSKPYLEKRKKKRCKIKKCIKSVQY